MEKAKVEKDSGCCKEFKGIGGRETELKRASHEKAPKPGGKNMHFQRFYQDVTNLDKTNTVFVGVIEDILNEILNLN